MKERDVARADHLAAISDTNCMHAMLQVCESVTYVCTHIYIFYIHIFISICTHADRLAAVSDSNCMHALLQVCENIICVYILYVYLYIYIYTKYVYTYIYIYISYVCTHMYRYRADHFAAIFDITCMHATLQVCENIMYVCTYIYVYHICIFI